MRLRAGVPLAIVAQIGSRRRVVRAILLCAISHIVAPGGGRSRRNNGIIIRVRVVVVAVVRPIAIAIARPVIARRERAPDHGTGNRAGEEPAAATAMIAAVPTAAALPVSAAAAKSRTDSASGAAETTAATQSCNRSAATPGAGEAAAATAETTAATQGCSRSAATATAESCS